MLLEPVFDVFLLCVKFTPCRAFFMMYLVRLRCQTCFSQISDAVSKTTLREFNPSNQFRIKENNKKKTIKQKKKSGEGRLLRGEQREGEKSVFEMSSQQRLEMPRALPNTGTTSSLAFFKI